MVSTLAFEESLHWKFWPDVERSVNFKTKVFVHTLRLDCFCIFHISQLPFLSWTTVCFVDLNIVSFFISTTCNIKLFVVVYIVESTFFCVPFENLEPSRVGVISLHIGWSSSILDVPRPTPMLIGFNGLGLVIKVPLLRFESILSLNDHVATNQIKISVAW